MSRLLEIIIESGTSRRYNYGTVQTTDALSQPVSIAPTCSFSSSPTVLGPTTSSYFLTRYVAPSLSRILPELTRLFQLPPVGVRMPAHLR